MLISHKHKAIFIHVPKTAGTSIVKALKPFDFTIHFKIFNSPFYTKEMLQKGTAFCSKEAIKRLDIVTDTEIWNKYFKFCFVRNPWDRFVSGYKKPGNTIPFVCKKKDNNNFADYCRNLPDESPILWHTKLSQTEHITGEKGNIMVDFVGRFENLQRDFNTICDKIGIKRVRLAWTNMSWHRHYSEYYDDETKEIIAKRYKKDIEMFGYKFEKPGPCYNTIKRLLFMFNAGKMLMAKNTKILVRDKYPGLYRILKKNSWP